MNHSTRGDDTDIHTAYSEHSIQGAVSNGLEDCSNQFYHMVQIDNISYRVYQYGNKKNYQPILHLKRRRHSNFSQSFWIL